MEPSMSRQSALADRRRVEQIIGVYDGLSATLADRCGFDWLHVGGYNISGSAFGMPDVGLLTLPEMVEVVRRVTAVTSRPVLVDGDDGYGNYLNVMRLVRMVEATGAAGIHLEDQVFPKKCGHMEGKRIVTADAFVSKIKAFVDTRQSRDFLLFARTDAIAVGGFEEAVERGNRYLEAGADVIFVEAPVTMEQVEALPKLIPGPLLYNWVWKGKSPLVDREQLLALGYRFYLQADVLYPVAHALTHYFAELKRTGTYGDAAEHMVSFGEFNDIVGLARIAEAERRYEPKG
jgi:2,3-dimethylmalate lyase